MTCPYYSYKGGYYCDKGHRDVNSDVYDKYCRSYDYDDCPLYKGESSSSSCFLTSACVRAKGLPDDCHELTALRYARDSFLLKDDKGKNDVCAYYHIAPQIVEKINAREDSQTIWQTIYDTVIVPCVRFIDGGDFASALSLYKESVLKLQTAYL